MPEDEGKAFKGGANSFERCFRCAAMYRHLGETSQMAEAVGLSCKSLYAKLEHLEIVYQR